MKKNKGFFFLIILFTSLILISHFDKKRKQEFKNICEQDLSALTLENSDLNCVDLEEKQKLLVLATRHDSKNQGLNLCSMNDPLLKVLSFRYEDPKENALIQYKINKCLGMNGLESYKTKLKSIVEKNHNSFPCENCSYNNVHDNYYNWMLGGIL